MFSLDCIWVLFGDLNVVRNIEERAGSSFNAHEASTFNEFIASSGLHDFPLGGRFTWFNKAGSKMSKLDRFLVSQNFFDVWPNASVTTMVRIISDHNPIFLQDGDALNGPTPFRMFDYWLGLLDFKAVVEFS